MKDPKEMAIDWLLAHHWKPGCVEEIDTDQLRDAFAAAIQAAEVRGRHADRAEAAAFFANERAKLILQIDALNKQLDEARKVIEGISREVCVKCKRAREDHREGVFCHQVGDPQGQGFQLDVGALVAQIRDAKAYLDKLKGKSKPTEA